MLLLELLETFGLNLFQLLLDGCLFGFLELQDTQLIV